MSTPAYAYGQQLGELHRGIQAFLEQVVAGFSAGVKPTRALSIEELEVRREAAYRRRIAREREIGMAFVRREADRARRELGLPPA